jgi:hypothetical protein
VKIILKQPIAVYLAAFSDAPAQSRGKPTVKELLAAARAGSQSSTVQPPHSRGKQRARKPTVARAITFYTASRYFFFNTRRYFNLFIYLIKKFT